MIWWKFLFIHSQFEEKKLKMFLSSALAMMKIEFANDIHSLTGVSCIQNGEKFFLLWTYTRRTCSPNKQSEIAQIDFYIMLVEQYVRQR